MQIVHIKDGTHRAVSGPGDIAGKVYDASDERLILSGTPTVAFVGYWATALGIFAAMGGAIEWRHNDAGSN